MIYSVAHGGDRSKALAILPEHSIVLVNNDKGSYFLVLSPWEFEEFKRPFDEQGMTVAIRDPKDFRERYPTIDLTSHN